VTVARVELGAAWVVALCASAALAGGPRDESRALYEEGQRHYHVGEYLEAAEAFKAAYKLSGAPGLLFNLAQAQRLGGDCDGARHSYQSYLDLDPSGEKVPMARSYLEELTGCTTAAPPAKVASVAAATVPADTGSTEQTVTRTRALWPLVLFGAGALMIAGGAYFGYAAQALSAEQTRQFALPAVWSADAAQREAAGRTDSQAAIGLWVVGAVVALAGAALFFLLEPS
jgi:hypothetical protein